MFRQSSTILRRSVSLSNLSRLGQVKYNSSSSGKPLCKHHQEMVPPFCEIGKLKSFELKSDCNTFHMKSTGYHPCCPPCPCPPKKPPCPCPPACPEDCPE